jgi:hypothetical protein
MAQTTFTDGKIANEKWTGKKHGIQLGYDTDNFMASLGFANTNATSTPIFGEYCGTCTLYEDELNAKSIGAEVKAALPLGNFPIQPIVVLEGDKTDVSLTSGAMKQDATTGVASVGLKAGSFRNQNYIFGTYGIGQQETNLSNMFAPPGNPAHAESASETFRQYRLGVSKMFADDKFRIFADGRYQKFDESSGTNPRMFTSPFSETKSGEAGINWYTKPKANTVLDLGLKYQIEQIDLRNKVGSELKNFDGKNQGVMFTLGIRF